MLPPPVGERSGTGSQQRIGRKQDAIAPGQTSRGRSAIANRPDDLHAVSEHQSWRKDDVCHYEIGQADSFHFIVTEFIDGETLRRMMTRASMSLGEVLDIGVQVASALSAAHRSGGGV